MIISISGVPGSGKTSVAKTLAQRLGYKFYSMGNLFGKMALERGLTLEQQLALRDSDPNIDSKIDEYQRELGTKEDNFVIEGRLSWHFIPHSFKVLLLCDAAEAAKRIYTARKAGEEDRDDEPEYASAEEALQAIQKRIAADEIRYDNYCGVDYRDPSHYDLVVDTTNIDGVPAVTDVVEKAVQKKTSSVA